MLTRLNTNPNALLFALCCFVWLCMPSPEATANGMRSHINISNLALKHVKGPLKAFLEKEGHLQALYNGSYFPDTGYAAKDGYGEMAHWEPFIEAFLQHLRALSKTPTEGEAGKLFAFLLGVASHSMADQVFDSVFVAKSRELNPGSDKELDTGLEMIMQVEHSFVDIPEEFVPAEFIVEIFKQRLSYDLQVDTIKKGVSTARFAMKAIPLIAGQQRDGYRQKMPWASDNIMNTKEPASLPYLGATIARVWSVLWERLHGRDSLDLSIVANLPEDLGRVRSLDHRSIESVLFVFFGVNMDKAYVQAENVFVKTASGEKVPVKLSSRGDKGYTMLKITPLADWKKDTAYTLTLGAALQDVKKRALNKAISLQFNTFPAKELPPEPSVEQRQDAGVSKPDVSGHEKTPPEQGASQGCGCDSSSSSSRWLFLGGLFLLFWPSLRKKEARPTLDS